MARRIILVNIGLGLSLSGVLASTTVGAVYSAQLKGRGGQAPYAFSLSSGALPDGMYLDPATGIISGVASGPGTSSFIVRLTDLSGEFVDRQFAITVIAEPLQLVGDAGNGTVGVPYSYTYSASGGYPPYSYEIIGAPPGLSVSSGSPILAGTPTTSGADSWTMRVTDSAMSTFDLPDSATFAYATLTLSGTYAAATVGSAYSSDLTIAGGNSSYSNPRATVGSVPPGLALSIVSGKLRLSGTPTGSPGTVNFTVAVDSGDGQTASRAQSIVVSAATSAYADSVLAQPSLWLFWKLDEASSPFADASGQSRAGSVVNTGGLTTHQASLAADAGYSVAFDVSNYIQYAGTVLKNDVAISQDVLVKLNSISSASQYLIHTGDYSASGNQGYAFGVDVDGSLFVEFGSTGFAYVSSNAGVVSNNERCVIGWSHNPSTNKVKFYKNGALIKTVSWTTGLGGAASYFTVGDINGSFGNGGKGYMDMPAVYGTVLTDAQFLANAQAAGLA